MPKHLEEVQETADEISKLNTPDNPVTEHLQRQVANALMLFINYKHYHWQVYGLQFRDLHLLFDEFAAEMLESFDEFAERLRMIGQDPIFSLDQVQKTATVEPAKGGHESIRQMLEEADRNLILTIKEMRDANEAAEDANDPGTIDLIGKTVRIAEKQEWYFRDMLKSGDTRPSSKSRS